MDSYKTGCQTVGSSLKPTSLSLEALQRGTKATIKATTAKSNEAIYKHPPRPKKGYIIIFQYAIALIFFEKVFTR